MTLKPIFLSIKKYCSVKRAMFFWYRHYKGMFFVGLLMVLGLGGFFWYGNLYQYRWSENQKKEFLDTHFKETVFKEKIFQDTVDHLKERARIHGEPLNLSRDIFSGVSIR